MLDQYREYKTDADKLKVYERRMLAAEKAMDTWKPAAEKWVARYNNEHVKPKSASGHVVNVSTGTAIIDSLFSSMTAADVDVRVESAGAGTLDQEYLASAALSKEWDTANVNEESGSAIKDSLLVGLGWVKVEYEYFEQEQTLPKTDEELDAEVEELVNANPDVETEILQGLVEVDKTVPVVLMNRIVVKYVPWTDVFFDPVAKRPQDVRWYAQVHKLPVEEVRENPAFIEYSKDSENAKKLRTIKGDVQVLNSAETPDDEDMRVTVVEMVDLETGNTCWYAKSADFILLENPNPFSINDNLQDRTPFVPCVLRRTSGRVRGISEMELMLPTLKELDLYRSRLATFIDRHAPKHLVEKGAITPAGKKALESAEYGSVVEMETGRVSDATTLQIPQLPSEMFAVPDKLEQKLWDDTGANELMRGLFPDRKRTATETAEVVTASAARQAEKRIQLERFYGAIARRILQLMQMMYTGEQMVRYYDYDGPIEWEWTSDDIVFETKLEVVLTPKETRNRQMERDEGTMMLNTFGPLAQPDAQGNPGVVSMAQLVRQVAEKMGVKRRDAALLVKTPAEIQVEQLQQQQRQAAEAMAAQGIPRPDLTTGPLDEEQVAAAANSGTIPAETLAIASGVVPGAPDAVEQVSESAGIAGV